MTDPRTQLTEVIADVRRRWRTKLMLRGAAIVVAGTGIVLVGSALGIDALRFSPGAIVGFRLAALAAVIALVALWLIRPMRRRVTDSQVALYVEEHEPSLEASILSAVETIETASPSASPKLLEKLVEQATERCRALNTSQTIDRQARRRFAAALVIVLAGMAAIVSFGPESMRHGLSALLVMTRAEAASPYAIEVIPGNVTAPRGSDQSVKARLKNFSSDEVVLMMRTTSDDNAEYVRVPLVRGLEDGMFEGILFDLMRDIEYFVESDGVRSSVHTMKLVDLPAVKEMDHEYRFPAYTKLPPQLIEGGGDIASLKGTVVRMTIESTMATTGGRIVFGDDSSLPLQVESDGKLTGQFTVEKKGFYRIELEGPNKEGIAASPSYTIDVIEDMAPTVKFIKPGRDTSATAVEEVFLEAAAEDDYGVKALELVYSVNGGEEKTVRMFGGGAVRSEVSAGHTLYLEELGVKVGDSVAYYAKAADNDGVANSKVTTSDIYFVKIRPFQQNFRAAQSQQGGGGGGGGGGGQEPGALSEKQRQVISATFNLNRDKAKMPQAKFKEDAVVVALSQSKLRDEVTQLMQQMAQRLGGDADFQAILQTLKKASEAMEAAEKQLRAEKTQEALAPENQALKYLQDAETSYEVEVRERGEQQGGGGGGGGNQAMAEDLADLFELERDRLANQYELAQSAAQGGNQQAADQQVDEIADRLKELAQRQLQEAERQRRQAAARQSASGSGSGQRSMAEELEELARQLEKLSREEQRNQEQRQQLADEARRMQQTANQMRQAAASGQQSAGGQAASAAQQLQEAQRRLQQSLGANQNPQQAIQDAQRRAQELVNEQKAVQSEAAKVGQPGAPGRDEQLRQLGERKDAMGAKVAALEQQLSQAAGQMRGDQRQAGNKLREAADDIRQSQLQQAIQYSKGAMAGSQQYSRDLEQSIGSTLQNVQNTINQAADAMNNATRQNAQSRALDQARNALRGLESLNDRVQQAAEQGQQGQQGQGQQGQQGQQGEQGQGQQQGQQGQQGQGQQGQQGQGQQGQQGQGQQGQQGQGQQGQQGQGQQGQQGQGQQGQQGQGREGAGQQMTDGRSGNPNGGLQRGPTRSGGASGDARNTGQWFGTDQARQFGREFAERANDIQSLRQALQQAGVNARDLDEIVRQLRQLDSETAFRDPLGMQQIAAAALEQLKKFEFDLRKKLDQSNTTLLLNGNEEIPPAFRGLVEEYYKSLAKKGGR